MFKEWKKDNFLVSTDPSLIQIDRVHRFLSNEAYWCLGIPLEVVKRARDHSLCFGVYRDEKQIGFARIVSDFAVFAWLADVYIEKEERGKGLSKWLMECICSHPDLQGLRRFGLATKDAHGLYEQFGFQVSKNPDRLMEIKNDDIYKRD